MNWLDEIKRELQRAEAAARSGNPGKVRTSARRAVGFALVELQRRMPEKNYGRDFITQLRNFAGDQSVPEEARLAADRLQARLSSDFESPSKNPIEDARSIIRFVTDCLA
jgi:HEPN domain-containing protein